MSETIVGKYSQREFTVKKTLGRGSSGAVHQVFEGRTPYALKLTLADSYDLIGQFDPYFVLESVFEIEPSETKTNDLKREIAIQREFNHPHIAPVVLDDVADKDGLQPFLVLPYGKATLQKQTLNSPLETEAAVKLTRQIGQGIMEIQSKGFLHGDIKPNNIIIKKSSKKTIHGQIIDFGSAIHENEKYTYVGTDQYSAPELIKGSYSLTEKYTWDTYGWAVGILYPAFTGFEPYSLEPDAIPDIMMGVEPFPARIPFDMLPTPPEHTLLHEAAEAVADKAMDPQPQARYSNMEAALADLEEKVVYAKEEEKRQRKSFS